MNNDKQIKKKIVYFPGLEQRLVEKGLQYLRQKNYDEAIDLLEQSIRIDNKNSESHIGLLLAYFDAGLIERAIELANQMLTEGIGHEVEIMNIYTMYLVQLHHYDKVVDAISRLLAENRIPADRLEHFHRLLDFSQRMLEQSVERNDKQRDRNTEETRKIDLYQYQTPEEQMRLVSELNNKNIIPYVKKMTEYLQSKEGSPFFKTLLLNVLKEHEYNQPVEIQKFDKKTIVIPFELPHIHDGLQLQQMLEIIGQKLENDDPVLFSHIKALVERHYFMLYPFELETLDVTAWAAAYHVLGNEYFGNHETKEEIREGYHVLPSDLNKADDYIRRIEEISSPNL